MRYFLTTILMAIVAVSFGQELYKQRSDINPSPALALKKQRTDRARMINENTANMFPKPAQDSLGVAT